MLNLVVTIDMLKVTFNDIFKNISYLIKSTGEDRRRWETEFGICHYAGLVIYKVKGIVDKNRDVQQDVFFDVISRSTNEYVRDLSRYQDLLSSTVSRVEGKVFTTET